MCINGFKVRQYHGSYYLPHNLSLIVTGKLSGGTLGLLEKIQQDVETSIVKSGHAHGPRPDGWKRPFLETPSSRRTPIREAIARTVEFPEKDESVGELIISFMGPPPNAFLERKVMVPIKPIDSYLIRGYYHHQALDILGTYLTSSAVAPLNKEFVEIENPLW
jgi:Zn-dependent M16 (insulinase) family peptidase